MANDERRKFISALRAMSAFILIRRAATGTTSGIDYDLRSIMRPAQGKSKLRQLDNNTGISFNKNAVPLEKLKTALIEYLGKEIKGFDEKTWINKVAAIPMYSKSRPLARFMILMAADGARPSETVPGTWTKDGARRDRGSKFLSFSAWTAEDCKTVEHVAPLSRDDAKKKGWEDSLYIDDRMHRLGNLILLPAKENSSASNQNWEWKRTFYQAASSGNTMKLSEMIESATNVNIPDRTIKLLNEGAKLSLLEPLVSVKDWDDKLVDTRTRNIAKLCWDTVWPWLDA